MCNIPKLRFPEFSGEWEEKRIDSIFDEKKEKNHPSEEVLTIIQGTGTVPRKESGRNIIFDEKSLSNYKFVQKDDFIIHLRSFEGGLEIANSNGIVSPAYIIMHPKLSIASKFYYSYFRSYKFINHVLPVSVEGVRDGRQIKYPILKEEKIPFTSFGEQQKIADFLSNVDSIITAETKILNTLQKRKKALMQKLFTQQLRFKSDDGKDFPAWEEKKLGDVCSVLSGKRVPKGNKLTSVNTGLKYITVSDMGDKFVSNKDIKYITQEIETKIKKYKVITGDIIISVAGTLGKVNIITEEFNNANLTENCDKLTEFKGCMTEYLFYFLQSEKFLDEINRIKTSSAQPKLALDRLRIFVIPIPIIEEQQKIADCLSSLDSLIQTQQKVVTTWQQRKKALLQQMFI